MKHVNNNIGDGEMDQVEHHCFIIKAATSLLKYKPVDSSMDEFVNITTVVCMNQAADSFKMVNRGK